MGPKLIPAKFVVGLDFGTSTTKCIATAILGQQRQRVQHLIPVDGLTLFPSTIWNTGENLVLGPAPVKYNTCYRSVKVSLRENVARNCVPEAARSELLSWVLLSFAVASAKAHLLRTYPKDKYAYDWENDVEWNMGVPLDGVEEQPHRAVFLRLLYNAVKSDLGLIKNASLAFFMDQYKSRIGKVLPPIHEQSGFANMENCFIFGEAHVAVNAFIKLQQGNVDSGLYYVCDVGAGTTDIAFFRFAPESERPIVFYSSSSAPTGGDECTIQEVAQVRAKNPTVSNDDAWARALQRIYSNSNSTVFPYLQVYQKIRSGRLEAFKRAWLKEQSFERWRKGLEDEGGAAVFGGGSLIPGVANACLSPIILHHHGVESIKPEPVILRKKLPLGMTELHRIAYGLSIPASEFYESWPTYMVSELRFVRPELLYNPFPFGSPYEI